MLDLFSSGRFGRMGYWCGKMKCDSMKLALLPCDIQRVKGRG
jgi:hypothetical protein